MPHPLLTVPNFFTFFRLALVPLMVIAWFLPVDWNHMAAAWLFVVASLTDLIDGWIARKFQQETPFGAFLDPIADKLMVITVLILLVTVHNTAFFSFCAIVVTAREITVSALREWLASNNCKVVSVSFLGKVKTFTQMVSLGMLLANSKAVYEFWGLIALALFYLATIMTIVSMFIYFKHSWKDLIKPNHDETSD